MVGNRRLTATNGNANYFWMMHFFYHLKDGGTAGYVMANGAMTTNTTEEKAARIALIEEGFVDCIVQLPDKLFFGTAIPACLWFLSKNRDGRGPYRKRSDEILFIDARKKGVMVSRRQRVFTDEEIAEIAAIYNHYREVEGEPQDIAGFCKTAMLDELRAQDYKLSPGIYVGTEQGESDDTPYEVRLAELTSVLKARFAESNALQERILNNLEELQ
jgi:type I restriction enzyme M protein